LRRYALRKPPERIRRHIDVLRPNNIGAVFADARLLEQFRQAAKRLIDAKCLDEAGYVNLALVSLVPLNPQSQRFLVGGDGDDAWRNLLRHGQPRS